jgi:glycosyltransferase involved in cell wall biosynthesis
MTRAPRVLMVSQHRYDPAGSPYPNHPTLNRNVSLLLARGVEVDLVCIAPRFAVGRRVASHPGLRLYGMPLEPRRSPAIWYPLQYVGFFIWAFLVVSGLALSRRYDVVQVDTLPDLLVFCALVPRLRRMPIVLYVYDLMPEMTAARLGVEPDAPAVRLVAGVERAATSWADRVITVTDLFRRIMGGRGLDSGKVALVANSHPLAELPPRVEPRSPVLVLQTTLIERYGVQVAIEAVSRLRSDWPAIRLEVIGAGEYRDALIALTERLGLQEHVVFSPGFVPWREAMEKVRRSTIGIVPIVRDGYGDLILPNKVFEFAFMEVPFVCSRLRGIEEHVPADAVAYFEPGDAAGLARQVHRLLSDPAAAVLQAARARQALAELAWENASQRYLEALGVQPTPARVA